MIYYVLHNTLSKMAKISGGRKVKVCYFIVPVVICLEKAMAPHSNTVAWKIPWMEKPGGLQSMGSVRVGHD